MTWALLFVLASGATVQSGAVQADAVPAHGARIASAQVSVEILRPVAVRQATGLEKDDAGPRPQVSRRAGQVLFEFE